jgi:uncharacterized repeat protein (TIGR03843 family)
MDRFPETSWNPEDDQIETLISTSAVRDSGLIPGASNYVFLLELEGGAAGVGYAVYKPQRGEAPLWDFPPSLYKREVACYVVSEALGWKLIPPTVAREEGVEHGPGSLQLYIPTDHRCTFFDLREEYADVMRRFATFDWLINNADRKGGHLLQGDGGHIWGIDNGLSFHVEEKLRTVIWDYAGEPVPEALLPDIERFAVEMDPERALGLKLAAYLDPAELQMLKERALSIVREPVLPDPPDWRRPYPWPLI